MTDEKILTKKTVPIMRAYEKGAYKVYPHNEHTFTHSFIMKGVMGERFPPSLG